MALIKAGTTVINPTAVVRVSFASFAINLDLLRPGGSLDDSPGKKKKNPKCTTDYVPQVLMKFEAKTPDGSRQPPFWSAAPLLALR
jgi:hypothetical protein